jgi:hypothetical protein
MSLHAVRPTVTRIQSVAPLSLARRIHIIDGRVTGIAAWAFRAGRNDKGRGVRTVQLLRKEERA